MRKTILSALGATFVLATAAYTNPAFATQTSTAISICVSRGTDCSMSNKDGGYQICVNNDGKQQCVHCPALGSSDQTCSAAIVAGGGTGKGVGTVSHPVLNKSLKAGKVQ